MASADHDIAAFAASHSHRLGQLTRARDYTFRLEPDGEVRAAMAQELDVTGLRKVVFAGALVPVGKQDWRLEARLGATVVQPCVATGDAVTTRIDGPVARLYTAGFETPSDAEAEMPEDDTVEALPDTLSLVAVLTEALALEIPDYPRADGAEVGAAVFGPPGVAPMTDEDAKPFAGLSALRDKLGGTD